MFVCSSCVFLKHAALLQEMCEEWLAQMRVQRLNLLGLNSDGDEGQSKNVNKISLTVLLDELMAAFVSKHSWAGAHHRTGGAPNLVNEQRKPGIVPPCSWHPSIFVVLWFCGF